MYKSPFIVKGLFLCHKFNASSLGTVFTQPNFALPLRFYFCYERIIGSGSGYE